jgi:hypothetical protein
MERIKRWAKGALAVLGAWLGGLNEWPMGQYDAQPRNEEEQWT